MWCSAHFPDGWSTVTTLYLTEQGWWDSLWRHTKACRTLTLSVLKLNVVRTALWDWPSTRQGRLMTTALLPWSPGQYQHPPTSEPFETALPGPGWNNAQDHWFNHEENPIPGSSNITGHGLMYGNRCSGSCLWRRLDASWASFVAASGRALLLAWASSCILCWCELKTLFISKCYLKFGAVICNLLSRAPSRNTAFGLGRKHF